MDRKIFVISDTHFGHANILKFSGTHSSYMRSFDSVEDMNECMVTHWNETVRPCDIVYHLGDVYFGKGWSVLPLLQGRKRLILGNHDNAKSPHIQNNFQKVVESRMFREYGCILTHRPIIIPDDPRWKWNVHGHIHDRPSPTGRHINVSVENTYYKPVELEKLLADI